MIRRVASAGGALLGVAAAGVLAGRALARAVIHPARLTHDQPEATFMLRRGRVALSGWVLHPDRPAALLYLGGNGERVANRIGDLDDLLSDRTVYLVAYRGYGGSGGRPSERRLVADAVALFDHISQTHDLVDVVGRSLGSGVAAQLAARRPVRRLVLVTPFDSVLRVVHDLLPRVPARLLVADRYDSLRAAPRIDCPVLVVRAELDDLVRPARTAELLRGFAGRAQEVVLAGASHVSVEADPAYFEVVGEFLRG